MMLAGFLFLLAFSLFFIIIFMSNAWISTGIALVPAMAITFLWRLPRILVEENSDSRRKSIRDQVLRDQKAFDNEKQPSPKSEYDDWERITSETSSRAATTKPSKSDYDGFIGFFHPFA